MKSLELLETKVRQMLENERKRREIAIKFAEKVTEILEPIGRDSWGDEGERVDNVVWVTRKRDGKIETTDIYFRYDRWVTRSGDAIEEPGFYLSRSGHNVWETPIEKLRGKQFWYVIQCILEWIPLVIEAIEKREESRDKLLSLINISELQKA